jgi:basic membrane protein A
VTLKRLVFVMFLPALLLSACAPSPQDCARADVFCVGLVTDFGPISEGINQEAWLGLQDAKDDHLVDRIDAIETIDARDRAKNISTLTKNGYDVIVTVGASISDETTAAAQEYPTLKFIGVEQPQAETLPNLTGLVFHEDRSGFLSGALAALMTQTKRVAALCEAKFIDSMRRYCDGFQAGANYADRDVNVSVSYRDGSLEKIFNDTDWGRTSALRAIQDGADVLFAAGGETADAALESGVQQSIYVIGAEADPYQRMPDIRPRLITSAINDIRDDIRELMILAREGKLPPGNYFGRTGLAAFHDLERQIPQDSKDRLQLIEIRLTDGSLTTGIPWSENESPVQSP